MSVKPKISLYLVHVETGQKYPVASEVVIGRSAGDIVFPDDGSLSSAHCRITIIPQGLGVFDLGSRSGTALDGRRLEAKKIYIFQPGSRLAVGQQEFFLQQPKLRKASDKPRRRRKKSSFDFTSFVAGVMVLVAAGVLLRIYFQPPLAQIARTVPITSPLSQVEREIEQAFSDYTKIGQRHQSKNLSAKALAQIIRSRIIPRFRSLSGKLGVVRPASEWERRKITLSKRHLDAMVLQVTAMASYAESRSPKDGKNLQHYSAVAQSLTEQLERLEAKRQPAYFDY